MTIKELEARRLEAARDLERGDRVCDLVQKYQVSRHTVYRWAARVENGTLLATKSTGRPKRKKRK